MLKHLYDLVTHLLQILLAIVMVFAIINSFIAIYESDWTKCTANMALFWALDAWLSIKKNENATV